MLAAAPLCSAPLASKDPRSWRKAPRFGCTGQEFGRNIMPRVTGWRFLQVSGGGAAAAQTAGIAGILATGRAPAYAQQTTLHWLRWNDFVPASDQLLKTKIAPQCEKDLGINLNVEGINANDIQARSTSSAQSATGPDILLGLSSAPPLYAA